MEYINVHPSYHEAIESRKFIDIPKENKYMDLSTLPLVTQLVAYLFKTGSKYWFTQISDDLKENKFYHYRLDNKKDSGVLQNETLQLWSSNNLVTPNDVLHGAYYGLDIPHTINRDLVVYYVLDNKHGYFLYVK